MSLKTPTKIAALLVSTVLAGSLLACATKMELPATDTESTIVWAVAGGNLANGHLDPHSSQLNISGQVQRNVFDSLVYLAADGTYHPWLAKDWTISADGLEYRFNLREDVSFHDGEKFNAAAAVSNFNHIVDKNTASAKAYEYLGGEFFVEAKAVEEYVLVLQLSQPFAPLLSNLSTAFIGFYSPKALSEHSQDEIRAGGPGIQVGTGPFILTEYLPNQELVYTRNDAYNWGPEGFGHEGAAAAKELVVRIVPEEASRIGALSSGEVQVSIDLSSTALCQLSSEVLVKRAPIPGLPYSVYLNLERGVFKELAVREAFMYALNLDQDVKAAFGGAYQRAWSILSPSVPNAYDKSLEGSWKFDAAKAAKLLDDAGWTEKGSDGIRVKDGQRLSVDWLSWNPYSDQNYALVNFMVEDLKAIGFELVHEAIEGPAYQARYSDKDGLILDFDLTDWSYTSLDADALRNHLHSAGYQNASRLADPELDKLLEDAATATDPAVRESLYAEVQAWNLKNVAIVPLYLPEVATGYLPSVQGLVFDAFGWPLFYGAALTK
ncbi:MAG: ABC transporter substrate-binding protein [Microbacteriaceae bacterium]